MTGDRIEAGEIVMMTGGNDDDSYVAGIFRAARDIDLREAEARFEALGPDAMKAECPEPTSVFGGMPRYSAIESLNFQRWLVDEGFLEPVRGKMLNVDYGFARPDGTGVGFGCSVADLVEEAAPAPSP